MYKVVRLSFDPYTIRILFMSRVERDCWDFIRNRLENGSKRIRVEARALYVFDKLGEFRDAPEDVKALNRYNKYVLSIQKKG